VTYHASTTTAASVTSKPTSSAGVGDLLADIADAILAGAQRALHPERNGVSGKAVF
jgi:hypothetical protein